MSMRLYLDTNAVHLLRRKWKPAEFDQRAATKGVVLALGAHVIYELGRGFLRGRGASEVRATCEFLSEIRNVEFLPQAGDMVCAELTQAELGVPIVTVLSPLNQSASRLELSRLACGYAEQAATFTARREASVDVGNPLIAVRNQKTLHPLRKKSAFEAFRLEMLPSGPATLGGLARRFNVKVSPRALLNVMARSSDFPTLTTWLNSQWYLGWVAVHKATIPGKLDDLRHLVESARCGRFVTEDGALAKVAPMISPSLECWGWQQLEEILM